jgi:hypothetical protein
MKSRLSSDEQLKDAILKITLQNAILKEQNDKMYSVSKKVIKRLIKYDKFAEKLVAVINDNLPSSSDDSDDDFRPRRNNE